MGILKDKKKQWQMPSVTFLTTSEKLNRYKSEKMDAILFLKNSFPGNFPIINIIPITEAEIKSIVSSLIPKKNFRLR